MSNAVIVQPLHGRRGRRPSIILRVYSKHMPGLSRRALYYRATLGRVHVALVDAGLMPERDHVAGTRWPLPLPVMYLLGASGRTESEVSWLARRACDLRGRGWTTRQLLHWLRKRDAT